MSILYVVATPIGNLKDVTIRALEVLKDVDVIFAEDTRVTSKLLARYGIKKSIKRYDEHIHKKAAREICELLKKEKKVAITTDAGSPGISDPAARLVSFVSGLSLAKIIPIPGPSAITAALSVSGISADNFIFLGFPPHKKKREKFFKSMEDNFPIVIFESPHRIQKTLVDLNSRFGEKKKLFIAKEMTKIFENYFSGAVKDAIDYFSDRNKKRGEFVIIIESAIQETKRNKAKIFQ